MKGQPPDPRPMMFVIFATGAAMIGGVLGAIAFVIYRIIKCF